MDHKLREMSALMLHEKAALHYSFSFFLYAQGIEIDFFHSEMTRVQHVSLSVSPENGFTLVIEWVNIGNRMGEFTKDRR